MTPIEFFQRLHQLPENTPLSLAHVSAALEMLSGILRSEPDPAIPQQARMNDETPLAQWLGEPLATIEDWRLAGDMLPRRYRLGSLLDWLAAHSIALSTLVNTGGNESSQDDPVRILNACWTMQVPALVIEDQLVGFFRSLDLEKEPAGYQVLHFDAAKADGETDIRALQAAYMSMTAIEALPDALRAYGEFAAKIAATPDEAGTIYRKWKGSVMPALLLQFFRAALLHAPNLAMEIADSLDPKIIRRGFYLAAWLWNLLLDHDLAEFDSEGLTNVVELADRYGVALNQASCVRNAHQRIEFEGTPAHLLADTKGDTFRLPPITREGENTYQELLVSLLERGLNVDLPNLNQMTGRTIAASVEAHHGAGQSLFDQVVRRYELNRSLAATLPAKPDKRRRQPV